MDEYEGIPDMSSDSEDEAAARCPVPESESDSDMDPSRNTAPQEDSVMAHAEAVTLSGGDAVAGGAGVVRPRDDADSDVASIRSADHSPKKARLATLPHAKSWNQDIAYEAFEEAARCSVDRHPVIPCQSPQSATLASMRELLMTVDVKRILEDLSNLPKFKLPARI